MRKFIILIFLSFTQLIGVSQNIKNGLYVIEGTKQFIYIKGDSISFNLKEFQSIFYYGKYHLLGNSLILEKNCALGKNTIISTSNYDTSYIGIELVEWKHDFLIDELIHQSKPYLSKSDLFSVHLHSKVFQSNDTILKISKKQHSDVTSDSSFFFASNTMTGYIDEVNLPLSFGKKYTLTQKYFNCQPAIEGIYPKIILKTKGKKTFLYYYNESEKKMVRFKHRGDKESCLNALHKLYSDL